MADGKEHVYAMGIKDAAAYFGIGENRLRRIIRANPNAEFVLRNGAKYLIRRKRFEAYLDARASI